MNPLALTVEIHDVSPVAAAEVASLRSALAGIGVERPTLLVVPRWEAPDGRRFDLREHPRTVEWLRAEQRRGSEIVQHGLSHRAPGRPPRGLRNAFMHRVFSRGQNEFAHLTGREAEQRLRIGREILGDCSLSAEGFIAPAWEQSPAAVSAVQRLGFRFTAFFNRVLPLMGASVAVNTTALTFDAPHPLVDFGKRAVMRAIEWMSRDVSLLRVALHPSDVHGARPLAYVLDRLRVLLDSRRLVTYAEWLSWDRSA